MSSMRHAGLFEHGPDRRDRAEAHDLGADRGDRGRDDPRPRLEAQRVGLLLRHDQDRRGAVVERAGVAGGDRTVGFEGGLERRELLDGRAGPRPVVARDGVRGDDVAAGVMQLGDLDADDLTVEVAALARRQRALLGGRGPLVLSLAADVAALGDVLGRDPHRDVDVVARAIGAVDVRVHQRERLRCAARHALHPGRDVLIALTRLDGMKRHPDRLQRRRAEPADRDGRDVMIDPRQQHGVAADVVALLPLREPAAHQHVVGLAELHARVAIDQRPQRNRREIISSDVAQRPLHRTPDRRPDRVNNHRFGHSSSSRMDPTQTPKLGPHTPHHIRTSPTPDGAFYGPDPHSARTMVDAWQTRSTTSS